MVSNLLLIHYKSQLFDHKFCDHFCGCSRKHQNKVVGFLKVGTKNLFLFDLESNYHELQPLCVLDFYVHESMQRQGCGKQLFEFMLKVTSNLEYF